MAMRKIWLIGLSLIAVGAFAVADAPPLRMGGDMAPSLKMTQRDSAVYRIGYLDRRAEELRGQLEAVESERNAIVQRLIAAEDAATSGTAAQ